MRNYRFALFVPLFLLVLNACTPKAAPGAEFWNRLQPLCGNAYEGKVVSEDAQDDDWRSQRIVMHVRECAKDEIRIALNVGEERSRVWVITRDGETLELRHDHHLPDGTEDAINYYGGFSAENSSGSRQNFPADETTKNLFDVLGLPDSKQNIWALEVRPEAHIFAYEMSRPGRMIRLEFDTSTPVDTPPAPWGYE